jgi:Pumilio-family RNA binding repeat
MCSCCIYHTLHLNCFNLNLNLLFRTRTVQKLIETIKTKEEISLVMSAFQTGFLDIVKDPNGNHVIQGCLQHFDVEDNKVQFNFSCSNYASYMLIEQTT